MLSQQVRCHLFTHSSERRHERRSNLPAHEARCLQYDAEAKRVLGSQVENAEEDDAGQGEALSKRLQER
jgi:hypothetical protein